MTFNSWFAQNPDPNPSFMGNMRWKAHTWGRQEFAKSFARGGFAATVFAPTPAEALISPWRSKAVPGTGQYERNLQKLSRLYPRDQGIQKAISSAKKTVPKTGMGPLGGALTAAFVVAPAFMTDGPVHERARAVTSGIGALAGFEIGSKTGMGIGAAIGTAVLPGLGSAIGVGVGWLAGGFAGGFAGEAVTDALTRVPDRMVESQQRRRNLDWGNNTAAFQTQRAHTMRQRSLAAMNRGQMSARSLLGQEATFVHR